MGFFDLFKKAFEDSKAAVSEILDNAHETNEKYREYESEMSPTGSLQRSRDIQTSNRNIIEKTGAAAINAALSGLASTNAAAWNAADALTDDDSKIGKGIQMVQNVNNGFVDAFSMSTQQMRDNSNFLGKVWLDLTKVSTEQLMDQAVNLIAPGASLISMGIRVFGSESSRAMNSGDSDWKAILAGAKAAGVEYLTEKISGIGGRKLYDFTPSGVVQTTGYLERAFDSMADRMTKGTGSKLLGTSVGGFISEAFEEMSADVLNAALDRILGLDDGTGKWWEALDLGDMLYNGFLGGLAGAGGAATRSLTSGLTAKQVSVDMVSRSLARQIVTDEKVRALFEQQYGALPKNTRQAVAQVKAALDKLDSVEDFFGESDSANHLAAAAASQNAKNNERAGVQAETSQEAAGAAQTQGDESMPPVQQAAPQTPSGELNSGFYQPGELAQYDRAEDAYGNLVRDNAFAPERVRTADDYERSAIGMQNAPRSKPWSASNTDILADVALENQALNKAEDEAIDALLPLNDIDTLEDAIGIGIQPDVWKGMTYWQKIRAIANAVYDNKVREYYENNPDADSIPLGHRLRDKGAFVESYVRRYDRSYERVADQEDFVDAYYGNEFNERVFEEVIKDNRLTPREKLNEIERLADEYEVEEHGWYINSEGELANENSIELHTGEDIDDDITKQFSNRSLSNTAIGAKGDKGQFVPDSGVKRSNREVPHSSVGTNVTSDMRAAREAEIERSRRLDKESKPKYPLKPTKETWEQIAAKRKLRSESDSAKLEANATNEETVGQNDGGKLNESESDTKAGNEGAEKNWASQNARGRNSEVETVQRPEANEGTGRRAGQSVLGSEGGNLEKGGGRGEISLLSEDSDLPSNRRGRSLAGKTIGAISFGENTYEVTKPNKRDVSVKNWIKRVSGYDVVLVHGDMVLNGKRSNGVRSAKNKTIYIDVSTGRSIQTAVHEVLHAKFDEARGNGERYSKSTEAFAVFDSHVNRNAEKKSAFNKVVGKIVSAYYDSYYDSRVKQLKTDGKTDSELLDSEIDKYVLARCYEETIIAIATKQTGNSVEAEIALLSSDARKILIGLGVADADFFNSIPYAKESDKIKPALNKPKAPKTAQDVVVDFALENANKPASQSAEPDAAEKLTGIPPLPKSSQATSQSSEDSILPFTFGEEPAVEPVSEPAKPVVEQAAATEPAGKAPKKLFGSRSDSVAKTAERIDGLKMFTENKAFKAFHGAKAAYVVYQELGKYKRAIREFSKGKRSIHELRDDFKGMLTNERLKMFSSDYIVQQLDQAVAAYDFLNSSDDVTQYDINKYNWAVDNVLKAIATRADTVNRIVNNQITVANAIKSKRLPTNIVGKAASSVFSLQLNAPTIFKMIDGFEKAKGGIGYALANVAEECAGVYAIERSNGNKFFEKFMTKEHAAFANDSERTGVKLDGHDLTQQEAVSVIRLFSTMDTPNRRKFAGLKGFMYEADGKEVWHDFGENPYEEFKQLHDDLLKALSPSAKSYIRSLNGMFGYYWPKLSSVQKRVSGNGRAPKAVMSYFPLRYAQKGKALEDYSLAKSMENASLDDAFEYISGPRPSILQSRSEQSGGYLVLEPASVVAKRYISQASQYIANADFSNTLELMNTTTALAPGLSKTLEAAWGKSYGNWMNKYISDMSFKRQAKEQSEAMELLSSVIRTGRRNLQQGALLLNPSTPLKQGAAAFVAFGEIKPTSVLKALATKRGASKGNALAADRRSGGIDPALADLLTQTDTWVGKLKSKSAVFKWMADSIGRSDSKVVDLLFRATMIDVASDNPSLDVNSARYKQLVEQRFEKVMLRTQSASYTSITSGLQRTDSELLKMVSMFRSQQAMEFNKVVQAIGESRAAKGSSNSESAKKYLRQTIAGQLGSAAFYGTMTAFVNALLHKHDRYEDEDDKVSVGKVLSSIVIDSAETLAGVTWLGDVAAQYLIEATTGKNEFYGLPLGPLDTVIDLFDSFSTFRNSPSVTNAKKVIGNASNLTGVPINNIYNVLNAAVMWSADLFGKNPKDYDDVIRFLDYNATIERRITGQSVADRMIALIGGDKPSETRQASYDAVRAQYDATGSSAFIPSDFDGSFTIDGNEYTLNRRQQREYVAARTDAYYGYLDDVVGSDIYENADEETRTAILNSAKAYADDAAKAAYFESMNIPYESSYKKLYEGVEMRGKDDDGNPKTDIPPVKPADIPEYLAWTATYKQAEKDKDYDAIDILLGDTGKLPASARTMFEHDVVDNLLAAVRGGASSESYYSYIAERNAGAKAMDITDGSSAAKLYGVSNAKMPDKDRNVLAELVLGENMYKVYDAAIESGVAPKHIPAIWDLIDADNSGKISQDELKEAHKSAGQYDDVFKNIWLAMVESGDWKKPWPYR